jgi:hypothetical protein
MTEHRDRERRKTLAKMSPAALEVWEELASGEERSKAGIARLRRRLAVPPHLQARTVRPSRRFSLALRRARLASDGLRVVFEGASMGAWEDSAETILDAA